MIEYLDKNISDNRNFLEKKTLIFEKVHFNAMIIEASKNLAIKKQLEKLILL